MYRIPDLKDFGLVPGPRPKHAVTLVPLAAESLKTYLSSTSRQERSFLKREPIFKTEPGEHQIRYSSAARPLQHYISVKTGDPECELDAYDYRYVLSQWARDLEPETYILSDKLNLTTQQKHDMALGWGLGQYRFDKYKTSPKPPRGRLIVPSGVDPVLLRYELAANYLAQDIINEPPNKMGCEVLEETALSLAKHFNAQTRVIKGDHLLQEGFELIHAVGRASREEPRLVEIRWGNISDPAVTVLGKGVVFDVGGINAKSHDEMLTMKTDKAGAAHALALAQLVMGMNLPVNLRILLPIVENANGIEGYKQGDVLMTRLGKTLQVVHTDAEGRLILSDALHEAAHPQFPGAVKPDLIIDYATLGWHGLFELPHFGTVVSNRKDVQQEFLTAVAANQEHFMPRPLMRALEHELTVSEAEGEVADLRQSSRVHSYYDDTLAALLLYIHVRGDLSKAEESDWLHMDLQPWRESNTSASQFPAELPSGGFARGILPAFKMIKDRYAQAGQVSHQGREKIRKLELVPKVA